MPIHFQSLFQDTWNFIRNRPSFTLYAIILLAVLQTSIGVLAPRPMIVEGSDAVSIKEQVNVFDLLLPSLLSMAVIIFVNVLLILNIKSINNGDYRTFLQNSNGALTSFFPAMLLTLVQVFPISLGLAFALLPNLGNAAPLMALPLMLMGLFVFIKLNLAIYVYLIDEPKKTIGETLKYTWALSRGRMLPLIIFTAIIYFLPTTLGAVTGIFSSLGIVGVIIAQAFNAFLNLAIVIFSFRFYQSYRL